MEESCNALREQIKQNEKQVRALMQWTGFGGLLVTDPNAAAEMRANIMLAVRHLEDARMRLGKVIQAKNGGVSCYDKPKVSE